MNNKLMTWIIVLVLVSCVGYANGSGDSAATEPETPPATTETPPPQPEAQPPPVGGPEAIGQPPQETVTVPASTTKVPDNIGSRTVADYITTLHDDDQLTSVHYTDQSARDLFPDQITIGTKTAYRYWNTQSNRWDYSYTNLPTNEQGTRAGTNSNHAQITGGENLVVPERTETTTVEVAPPPVTGAAPPAATTSSEAATSFISQIPADFHAQPNLNLGPDIVSIAGVGNVDARTGKIIDEGTPHYDWSVNIGSDGLISMNSPGGRKAISWLDRADEAVQTADFPEGYSPTTVTLGSDGVPIATVGGRQYRVQPDDLKVITGITGQMGGFSLTDGTRRIVFGTLPGRVNFLQDGNRFELSTDMGGGRRIVRRGSGIEPVSGDFGSCFKLTGFGDGGYCGKTKLPGSDFEFSGLVTDFAGHGENAMPNVILNADTRNTVEIDRSGDGHSAVEYRGNTVYRIVNFRHGGQQINCEGEIDCNTVRRENAGLDIKFALSMNWDPERPARSFFNNLFGVISDAAQGASAGQAYCDLLNMFQEDTCGSESLFPEFDKFFQTTILGNYLSGDTSMLCAQWTDNQGQGMILGPDGNAAAWITAERISLRYFNETLPREETEVKYTYIKEYIYKISFEINPSGMLQSCQPPYNMGDYVRWYLTQIGGNTVDRDLDGDIERGMFGEDQFRIRCDEGTYSATGQDLIVRYYDHSYDKICLEIIPYGLDAYFLRQLDREGVCNVIMDSGTQWYDFSCPWCKYAAGMNLPDVDIPGLDIGGGGSGGFDPGPQTGANNPQYT